MIRIVEHDNCSEFEFEGLETWEDFEVIAEILENKLGAVLVNKTDGPYSRLWDFQIGVKSFRLKHDDFYGNTIKVHEASYENAMFLDLLSQKIVKEYTNN